MTGSVTTARTRRWLPPWLLPTGHGIWLLVVGVGMFVAGRIWSLDLVRDAGVLLLCIAAASFLTALVTALLVRRRTRLTGPSRLRAGAADRWEVVLDGHFGRTVPAWVRWRAVGLEESAALVEGRSELLFVPPRRGACRLEVRGLTFVDPLGAWRVHLPLREGRDVLVLPRSVEDVDVLAGGAATGDLVRVDRGEELAGLRDYRHGDHLSSIHWRQSARIDRLVVVESERRTRVRRTVVLDVSASSYRGRDAAEAHAGFETAVAATAGVLEAWAVTDADLRLVVGQRVVDADDAVAGPKSRRGVGRILALLETLALVDTADDDRAATPPEEVGVPDVVVTGAAGRDRIGRGPTPGPASVLLVVGGADDENPAGPASPAGPAGAPGMPAATVPASWRARGIPVGAEYAHDAAPASSRPDAGGRP